MKILIAEDTEDSRIILEMALVAEGYDVQSAVNGAEALHFAKVNPPDLIISDILMPEMDGYNFCRSVKDDPELCNIPFIFYTATYTDKKDEELALTLGADKFVTKPQEPARFIEIIKDLLKKSKKWNKHTLSQEIPKQVLDDMHLQAVSRKLNKKISELESEKESLKQSEEKYQHLLGTVQNYFFFYNRNTDGYITSVSPSVKKLLGYTAEEFTNHYSEYLSDNPINKYAETYFSFNNENYEQHTFEIEIHAKNHSLVWLEIKEFPATDNKGNVTHVEGIALDITKRKQFDEILRRSQKMEALGNLTSGIVHDYNNMLGIILGYAELLEENLEASQRLAVYASRIHDAAERGRNLSRKLLSFTKHIEVNKQPVNINSFLTTERDMLIKTMATNIHLKFELGKDIWLNYLDTSDLEDAIINLCLNAKFAMKTGGELTIQTSNKIINTADAQLLNLQAGDYVLLTVSDSGCGIDERIKDKIFDPFYTTKGSKGTGLGLSQVYGFVHRSEGTIKVDSEVNTGTKFNLYFPRYKGTTDNLENNEPERKADLSGTETILIVDDEPALLNLAREILTLQGYNVSCASTGKEALEILESRPFNLLFSDIIMPEVNGLELAATVREKFPEIKILLTSGFNENPDEFRQNSHQQFIQKPYNSIALLTTIHEMIHPVK